MKKREKTPVSEFLSRSPKWPPDGCEPLTLARLPDAIQRLRRHENTRASMQARGFNIIDHSMGRLKQQVGEFITELLITEGAAAAQRIANKMKAASMRKSANSESEGLRRVGRDLFISLLLQTRLNPKNLPTKAQFRNLVLWRYACNRARKRLGKEGREADELRVAEMAAAGFKDLQARCKGGRAGGKLWRRIASEMGLSGLPHDRAGRPKLRSKKS